MSMRDSEKKVGRADHNDRAAQEISNSEQVVEDTAVEPERAKGSERGGSASWGSEGSGGSVIDERPDR
jgi:hypothetical protein